MSPSNPEKLPQIVFRGDPDNWSDVRNTIELYLRTLDPPLIGYLLSSDYDGTQTTTLDDGTVYAPIRSPDVPVIPPSTTGSASGGGGLGGDDDGDEDEERERKKHKKDKKRKTVADLDAAPMTVLRELSKVSLIIQQCMSQDIRTLIHGKKPYDQWKLLNERYGTADAVSHEQLLQEITDFKIRLEDDPALMVAKFDVIVRRYEQATGTVYGDIGRSVMLRRSLPKEWKSMVQSWHGQDSVIKYAKLRSLVEREKARTTTTAPRKETALAAVTTGDTATPNTGGKSEQRGCFKCHLQGHEAVNCPSLTPAQREDRRKKVELWRAEKAKNMNQKNSPGNTVTLTQSKLDALMTNVATKTANEVEQRLRSEYRRRDDDHSARDRGRQSDDYGNRRNTGGGQRGRSPDRRGRSRSRARSRSPRRDRGHDDRRYKEEKRFSPPRHSRSPDRRSSFSPGARKEPNTQRALFAHAYNSPPGHRPNHWRNDSPMSHGMANRGPFQSKQEQQWRGNWPPNDGPREPYHRQAENERQYGPSEASTRRDYQSPDARERGVRGDRPPHHGQSGSQSTNRMIWDGANNRERHDSDYGARQWGTRDGDRGRMETPTPRHDDRYHGRDNKRRFESPLRVNNQ